MSHWAGKYVIGLTGNIGTGKSVVRRMLEHLGAYGIDADALAHRVIAKGAPGYAPVVDYFGKYILKPDGEIDRARLGRIVFGDAEALAKLESIIHPLVRQASDFLIRRATQPVIVVEAIKLIESGMAKQCDSLWVVYAPPDIQLARLMKNRGMSEKDARQRIASQPPQEEKIAAADVVIRNAGTFDETWKQVVTAWRKYVPLIEEAPPQPVEAPAVKGQLQIERGRPRHSAEIAELLNRLSKKDKPMSSEDIMAAFGEKAFLLLRLDQQLKGLLGWQVENLVARTTDIHLDPSLPVAETLPALIHEMEKASSDLQCEASLIFVPPSLARHDGLWQKMGYQRTSSDALEVQAWQDAARESMPAGTVLLFKKLREDRVLRPI
ncbi:MAG: dephospho-CoA kinase [Chloroflexota bacterium]